MLERECVETFELQENTHFCTVPLFPAMFYRLTIIHVSEQKETKFIAKHTLLNK